MKIEVHQPVGGPAAIVAVATVFLVAVCVLAVVVGGLPVWAVLVVLVVPAAAGAVIGWLIGHILGRTVR